jgi:hypothetical protein
MDTGLREHLSKLGPVRALEKPSLSGATLTLMLGSFAEIGGIQSIAAIMGLYRHTALCLRDAKRLIEDVLVNRTAIAEIHSVTLAALEPELAAAGVKLPVL